MESVLVINQDVVVSDESVCNLTREWRDLNAEELEALDQQVVGGKELTVLEKINSSLEWFFYQRNRLQNQRSCVSDKCSWSQCNNQIYLFFIVISAFRQTMHDLSNSLGMTNIGNFCLSSDIFYVIKHCWDIILTHLLERIVPEGLGMNGQRFVFL